MILLLWVYDSCQILLLGASTPRSNMRATETRRPPTDYRYVKSVAPRTLPMPVPLCAIEPASAVQLWTRLPDA